MAQCPLRSSIAKTHSIIRQIQFIQIVKVWSLLLFELKYALVGDLLTHEVVEVRFRFGISLRVGGISLLGVAPIFFEVLLDLCFQFYHPAHQNFVPIVCAEVLIHRAPDNADTRDLIEFLICILVGSIFRLLRLDLCNFSIQEYPGLHLAFLL